jgi:acylphosphatase
MPEKASFHAIVSGRVQGVFYRMFVYREANALGVCGTVHNLLDGRVEVRAEGFRSSLETLLERLRKGPPRAQVTGLEVDWGEYGHDFDRFDIEY